MIKNASTTLLILLASGLLLPTWGHCQTTRYVASSGSDFENLCSSAANPCATIGRAVDVAVSGDPVQVAAGIYTESLDITKSVAILGEDRDTTIIQAHALAGMAERNVISLSGGATVEVVIADVTIRHGRAVAEANLANLPNIAGGGIFNDGVTLSIKRARITTNWALLGGGMLNQQSSPELIDVVFHGNTAHASGGAMVNFDDSSPNLTNVAFYSNLAVGSGTDGYGGGMVNYSGSSPQLVNAVFSGNRATNGGGGMFNQADSNATLINVLFSGNLAAEQGGGMENLNSSPRLVNVTFNGNRGLFGGAIKNTNSDPILTNVIIWGNSASVPSHPSIDNETSSPVIGYSLIELSGGSGNWDAQIGGDAGGNLDTDPMFVDELDPELNQLSIGGNLRLNAGSPAIDAGLSLLFEPGHVAEDVTSDLDGQQRIFGADVDMGAYEFQPDPNIFSDRFEQ